MIFYFRNYGNMFCLSSLCVERMSSKLKTPYIRCPGYSEHSDSVTRYCNPCLIEQFLDVYHVGTNNEQKQECQGFIQALYLNLWIFGSDKNYKIWFMSELILKVSTQRTQLFR